MGSPNPGLGSDACETVTAAAPTQNAALRWYHAANQEHEAALAFSLRKMAPLPTRHTLSYREIGLIIHSPTHWFRIQSPPTRLMEGSNQEVAVVPET